MSTPDTKLITGTIAPETKLTAQTNPQSVSLDSSLTFHSSNREVLRITNEARLVIGEGLSKEEATQETAKLLVAAFEERIQEMVDKRVEKAEADTKRLDWIASRKSTELVYFAAAGWSIIKSNGGDLLCDQNIHNFRDAIDAAMKEASK